MFDLRINPANLRDLDIETLLQFGTRTALATLDSAGETSPEALIARLEALFPQRERLQKVGLTTFLALGLPPTALPRRGLLTVLDAIPRLFRPGLVRAIGPLGITSTTRLQADAFNAQLALADTLRVPILISLPTRRAEASLRAVHSLLKDAEIDPRRVCLEGTTPRTLPTVLSLGYAAAITMHPDYNSVETAVALVQTVGARGVMLTSAAGQGPGDLLALSLARHRLEQQGVPTAFIRRVTEQNAAMWLGN